MSFDGSVPGWMTPDELALIRKKATGKGDALEVGTYCGLTTRCLLAATEGTVFTIDPFERSTTDTPKDPSQRKWVQRLAWEYPDRLVVLPCKSREVIWTRPIDILVIDGDHSREAVLDDIIRLSPFVQPGGYLFLDDYLTAESVRQAWNDFKEATRDRTWISQGTCGKLAFLRKDGPTP